MKSKIYMKQILAIAFLNVFLMHITGQSNSLLKDATITEVTLSSLEQLRFETNTFIKYDDKEGLYLQKVASYTKMKKTGIGLGVGGGSCVVIGAVLVTMADWESYSNSTGSGVTTQDASGVAGIVFLLIGVPLTVTGIVLGSIGAKKVKYYNGLLQNVSFDIKSTPQQTGIKLTYRF